MREQPDTRTRIQEVALELFTEHGYEATSLREISERLGVTKAALYYHFKTKEDIVASLIQDRIEMVDALIAWAETMPPGEDTRHEFIRRYAEELHRGRHLEVMRFFERNQTALKTLPSAETFREQMLTLLNILSLPGASLVDQLRSSLAILVLHATWFVLRDPDVTDEQRRAAALEVALGLVDSVPARSGTPRG